MGDEEVRQAKQSKQMKMQKINEKPSKVSKQMLNKQENKNKEEKEKGKEEFSKPIINEKSKENKKEEKQRKQILEREYIIPLRKEWLKVPEYKRANKAIKAIKEFIVRHMKIYDRDLRKAKIDILLNNEIRFKGMKKPPIKIKVKAIKYNDDTVDVKLVNLPKSIEFKLAREIKRKSESIKKVEQKKEEIKTEEIKEEKKEETKEKQQASKEAMQEIEKQQAKEMKHTPISKVSTKREPIIHRQALKK